jgi:chromate transporter
MADLSIATAPRSAPSHGVSSREAFWVWVRVAALSFGGPAGQIAVMHRILVEEKRWIGETRFLHALNYCMLLPGPEAHQLAVYIGWLLHRTRGGIVAGTLFVLPGLICLGVLSWIYAAFGNVGAVQALFFGLKAAVLAVVLEAVVRVGRRALKSRRPGKGFRHRRDTRGGRPLFRRDDGHVRGARRHVHLRQRAAREQQADRYPKIGREGHEHQ